MKTVKANQSYLDFYLIVRRTDGVSAMVASAKLRHYRVSFSIAHQWIGGERE